MLLSKILPGLWCHMATSFMRELTPENAGSNHTEVRVKNGLDIEVLLSFKAEGLFF